MKFLFPFTLVDGKNILNFAGQKIEIPRTLPVERILQLRQQKIQHELTAGIRGLGMDGDRFQKAD